MWAGSVTYWPRPQCRRMRDDAAALKEHLDDGAAEADLDVLVQELVGDAVVVVLGGDVVVDVDGGVVPLAGLVAGGGQGPQRRAIELLEQRQARDAELLAHARVEGDEQLADGGV